jgi:hypothetical protein
LQSMLDEPIVKEALAIVEAAEKRNVVLRLLGALAITLRSSEWETLQRNLKRLGDSERTFTDIDLIGYTKQRPKVRQIMEDDLGYIVDQNVLLFRGKERLLYHHPKESYNVDIFFDSLRFSHDISFGTDPKRDRLLLHSPTISPTDLLLEKLQIHSISEKDLKDIIVLLRAHELGPQDSTKSINLQHLVGTLQDDWGFWKDATANLQEVVSYAGKYNSQGMIAGTDVSDIATKVSHILNTIDEAEKTMRWKLRERTGESKQWWNDVEDVSR